MGARVAGASTAMLLARRGCRVLLIDRATFPSDTLSTHYLWPRGTSYLSRWGVLDPVRAVTPLFERMHVTMEGIDLRGGVPLEHLRRRFGQLHRDDAGYVTSGYCSVRRTLLDALLIREAERAGAELRTGFTVEAVTFDRDRVAGVLGRGPGGAAVHERATVVVGADGRRSFIADAVGAPILERHETCSFAYYSYFSDIDTGGARLIRKARLGVAAVPTNADATMVLLYGPGDWFDAFRSDAPRNFLRGIGAVDPEFRALIRAARRQEKFRGTNDMAGFWRAGAGRGWLLVGDAACFKDQSSASGITHAFRDADLAAEAISRGLDGECGLDEALREYDRRRLQDGHAFYGFACLQGQMNPIRLDEVETFEAISDSSTLIDRFISIAGDSYPVGDLLSPEERAELFRARAPTSDAVRRADAARIAEACRNPFVSGGRS